MHNRLGHRFQRRLDVPVWLERGPQGLAYADRILEIDFANLIGYWPLWEDSGVIAENYQGVAARDGVYARDVSLMGTVDGIGDGNTAPLFTPGSGDLVNIGTGSLAAIFDQAECFVSIWIQVRAASVWSDGIARYFWNLTDDAANRLVYQRNTVNNQTFARIAGGAEVDFLADNPFSFTDWFNVIISVSESNNITRFYTNGIQTDSQPHSGPWVGPIISAVIGAQDLVPNLPWDGGLAHMAIWNADLGQAGADAIQL